MEITLNFSLSGRDDVSKVARFKDPEEKRDYVEAEFKDLKCIDAYREYQSAFTAEERATCANKLCKARLAFFRKWQQRATVPEEPEEPGDSVA